MNFHEVRFPAPLSVGSSGGPERRTEIVELRSGFEERNTPWAHSRRRYDAGLGVRSLDDLAEVIAFFEARRGQLYGFRWKDWTDFKSSRPSATPGAFDQTLGTGDGARRDFALVKGYASGETTYRRPVPKPVDGTVRVGAGGVALDYGAGFSVDHVTGVVRFATPPTAGVAITAGFEFDVPVRFDTDRISTSLASFAAGEIPSIAVVELRV
ncbi:MAG: DUF2460 domain-containing protein [Rhodobacteraceae bacterium]|nr:DUF2460 domain-containing protein [Paracoccaceae bacterium]